MEPLPDEKGFFSRLFNMSFTEFISIRIISVLYGLAIAGSAVAAIVFLVSGFSAGAGRGILYLVLSPLVFLLLVIASRIWCEMVVAAFRIAENTGQLVEQGKLHKG